MKSVIPQAHPPRGYRILRMAGILTLSVVAFLTTTVEQAASLRAANYYVRTSGNDDNDGTSNKRAFRTIAKAANIASSGDTVYVGGGTYVDPVLSFGSKSFKKPVQFIADINGNKTGDRGIVRALGAPFRVTGSNRVEISYFTFQGENAYPVIWEDSFDGRLISCRFVGGNYAMIMKDGSLTMEDCFFANFKSDAIQVDGAARLHLQDCRVEGAAGNGIAVSKTAEVTLDNTYVRNNTGNGLQVVSLSTPIGLEPPTSDCECTGTSPVAKRKQAESILDSLNPKDPTYKALIRDAADRIDDTLSGKHWKDDHHLTKDGGKEVFKETEKAVKDLFNVYSENVTFRIVNGEIIVDHDFVAEITVVGAAIKSGNYNLPVTVQMDVGKDTLDPFGPFSSPTKGNVNDDKNPRTWTTPKDYKKNDNISVSGRSWLKRSGKSGNNDSDFYTYMTVNSASGSPNVWALQDGDSVPTITGFGGQQSAETFLKPYIDEDGFITLAPNQAIYLFELGTTNLNSSSADFQDLVTLITMKRRNYEPLTAKERDLIMQAINLLMDADRSVTVCSYNESGCAKGDQDDLEKSQKHLAKAEEKKGKEEYHKAVKEYKKAWEDARKANDWEDFDFQTALKPAPPSSWTAPINRVASSDSYFTGNASGVVITSSASFSASDTDFSANQAWGLQVRGTVDLTRASVANNLEGGLLVLDTQDGQMVIDALTLSNNRKYGILFDNPNLTVNNTLAREWTITGSNYALASRGGSLTLDGLTVQHASTAGIYTYQGSLTVKNSTISDNGYGIATDESDVTVQSSTLSRNDVGLYFTRNNSADVRGSTLTANRVWGATVYAKSGGLANFDGCTVHSNAGGISLLNAGTNDFALKNSAVRDNSQSGLHFENCTLTLNSQVADSWSSLRNRYAVSVNGGSVVLDGVSLLDSTSYGLHNTGGDVVFRNGFIRGRDGAYSTGNGTLTLDASTIASNVSVNDNWGVYQDQGGLTAKNVLIKGFADGVRLSSSNGKTAKLLNSTIVLVTGNGVLAAGGVMEVRNTLLSSNNGTYGLNLTGGAISHSHNLVDGFTTPFQGTTPAETDLLKKPRFADAANGDYHLRKGSPAINAGIDLSASVPTDLDGNARPAFDAFEIGAYEFTDDNGGFRILTWSETR